MSKVLRHSVNQHHRLRAAGLFPVFSAALDGNLDVQVGTGPISIPGGTDANRWGFNGTVWAPVGAGESRYYDGALYMEWAHTELSGYSGDIGSWSTNMTASVAQNAVGLRGNSNEAFSLTDNSNTGSQQRRQDQVVSAGTETYYTVFRIPFASSQSVFSRVGMILMGGGGPTIVQSVVVNQNTGATSTVDSDGQLLHVVRVGDWWFVLQSLVNGGLNTTVGQFCNPAWNTDGSAAQDVTAQGSNVVASCELYKDSPSYAPILTTGGSTKTVNADTGYTIPLANWPDGDVSVEMEVTPFFDQATGANQGVLTPNSGSQSFGLYLSGATAKRVLLSDGVNFVGLNDSWSAVGDTITIKARASVSEGKMNLSSDGVAATEGNYDGSFNPSGSIVLGKSLTRAMAIKNIRIWSIDRGSAWLAV